MNGLHQIIQLLEALLSDKFLLRSLLLVVSLFVLFHLIRDVFADRDTPRLDCSHRQASDSLALRFVYFGKNNFILFNLRTQWRQRLFHL